MNMLTHVNTYTHSVAYVSDKMLTSLKRIILWSGLDPTKLTSDWNVLDRGLRTWLGTQDLETVVLEVYRPGSQDILIGRWDFDIRYGYGSDGDGEMWVDTDAIRHAIAKCGVNPTGCRYRIIVETKSGRPDVEGWIRTSFLSTDGFVRHSVGTTIGAAGLGSSTAYWRRS